MIVTLEGLLTEIHPLELIIEINGIGYQVFVPISTSEKLPCLGSKIKLNIHSVFREESHSLYGFLTIEERDIFRLMIEKVSGIGPKIAISLLSKFCVYDIKQAIVNKNSNLLCECPGIGKKTAERISLELKDKIKDSNSYLGRKFDSTKIPQNFQEKLFQDAVSAMVSLGYKILDAEKTIGKVIQSNSDSSQLNLETIIKQALKK